MKKYTAILCVLLLCLSAALPVFAESAAPRLVDGADYLTDAEEAAILSKLDDISTRQGMDVVIVTVPQLDGKDITAFADDFYDENDEEMVKNALKFMHEATLSDYFITDTEGKAIYCCDIDKKGVKACPTHLSLVVSKEHMERALGGGFSDYTTQDEFGIGKFVVAVPIKLNGSVRCDTVRCEECHNIAGASVS